MKLNKKLFDKDVEQVPIRKGFGEGLLLAGEENKNIVALCADLTESTQMHLFKNKFPERFVEIGVAEQNLASVASGMSAMGKIPVISSYAMFSPGRNWEQIRTTICYNDRKVIIGGSHAGVSVGPDGGTHQAVEDIAITRVLPNMTVISPCDAIEAKKATLAALSDIQKTPVYIRLAREKTPVITTDETPFEIGKGQIFYESENPEVTIVATGALVYKALLVAKELEEDGVGSIVVNLTTIKPLDEKLLIKVAKATQAVVTVEEHQIAGGMGSAVAECLSKEFPVPIEFIGVKDVFGQSGTPDELIAHYEMDVKDIKKACEKVIERK
jgi:transketolase